MPNRKQLDNEFAEELRRWLPSGERYLVAVSGGRDSMTLLHFLRAAGYTDLTIAHVNHNLREEAGEDEGFVKEQAGSARFIALSVDVRDFAEKNRLSLETAAREVRYRAFSEISEETGCDRVFLGHHADDQVETVLINLFRGSGSRGLAGMQRESKREALTLLRPFLEISREEIDRYVLENEIAYREDATNADDFALRNRVRHRMIPTINEVFERNVRDAVLRSADSAQKDAEWATILLSELPHKDNGLSVEKLRELPEAKRNRLLLLWLRESAVPDCGAREVAKVVEILLSDAKPAKTNLPGDVHARRRAGVLFLEFPEAAG